MSLLGLLGWKSQGGQSSDGELVTSRGDVGEQMRAVPKEHTAVETHGRGPAAHLLYVRDHGTAVSLWSLWVGFKRPENQ